MKLGITGKSSLWSVQHSCALLLSISTEHTTSLCDLKQQSIQTDAEQ